MSTVFGFVWHSIIFMEENMIATLGRQLEPIVIKVENILVQVTTMKLTKDNYLYLAVVIITGIACNGCIEYINEKKMQSNEDDHS